MLEAMAAKGIESHLFLLYQGVILNVIDCGLVLRTLPQSNMPKLNRVQNKAMRVVLETTKETYIEAMSYLLDLPPIETRDMEEQVKAYLNAMQNPKNPLYNTVNDEKGCRLSTGKSWIGQAEKSIQHVCGLTELKQASEGKNFHLISSTAMRLLPENRGSHCHEGQAWTASVEIQMLVEASSKPHDMIYMNSSVTTDQSG